MREQGCVWFLGLSPMPFITTSLAAMEKVELWATYPPDTTKVLSAILMMGADLVLLGNQVEMK